MAFKFQARTLLQLGAELISSDSIALFELIKNSFDAGSPDVRVRVLVRLSDWPGEFPALIARAEAASQDEEDIEELRRKLISGADKSVIATKDWITEVKNAKGATELCQLARTANYIKISDKGHGMSLKDLDDIYLTIGTPHRLLQKTILPDTNGRKIQGEKGLGRLAAMRLGDAIEVRTSTAGNHRWNILEIDWELFGRDPGQMVSDIEVAPKLGPRKEDPSEQGTTLTITNLKSGWDSKKLQDYADEHLSRITDPFAPEPIYSVKLLFNSETIKPDRMDTHQLRIAHATLAAAFKVHGTAKAPIISLSGTVNYALGEKVKTRNFNYNDLTHLKGTTSAAPDVLFSLGSFSVQAYWFNRQALRERRPDGPDLVKWVNKWSGGLMLFRDGFRVHPYANPDDDWLRLDKKALASGGYKVNRKQLVGKVDITARHNPRLTDQTNREGLRDCPEKAAFVTLLQAVLETELRSFMNSIEREKRATLELDLKDLAARAAEENDKLTKNFNLLKRKIPRIAQESEIVAAMEAAIHELETVLSRAQAAADEMEEGRGQLIHLAGLGLMVEMLAHELNRSTQFALNALEQTKDTILKGTLDAPLSNLELQLRTLSKRLRSLDPATTSGRHRSETFDLVELVEDIVAGHKAEFQRHNIECDVQVLEGRGKMRVKMVKGMVVQILENLLSNSLYWLKQHATVIEDFAPSITIELNVGSGELSISDNGPGVLESIKSRLFTPFFTTKPPGHGKGLGLFIARDIARYHGCALDLSDEQRVRSGHYNTFILTLPNSKS